MHVERHLLEVDRGDFRRRRVVDLDPTELADGEALLRVDRFALTANNVSYAASGDMLDYWGFFPTEEPWGRIPVMGVGVVTASRHDAIDEGGRYFGFYPMGTHLVVEPEPRTDGFVDGVEHRRNHAGAYRRYAPVSADPAYDPGLEDHYLLVKGLFLTSFLVDDLLADNDFFGADTTIVTSASSKTSIALAHQLARRDHGRTIGLTSPANVDFVEGLGHYDEVATYDDIDSMDASAEAVIVDMAGNAGVLDRLHSRLANLRYSCLVGATHWESFALGGDRPGPRPTFFFAPTQMKKLSDEWGPDEFGRRTAEGLRAFVTDARRWLHVTHGAGPDAVSTAYDAAVNGSVPPDRGVILSMWPDAFADER